MRHEFLFIGFLTFVSGCSGLSSHKFRESNHSRFGLGWLYNKYGNDDNEAVLTISHNGSQSVLVSSRNEQCVNCSLVCVARLNDSVTNVTVRLDTFYPNYKLFVHDEHTGEFLCSELSAQAVRFGERGNYLLTVSQIGCSIATLSEPDPYYMPLVFAVVILFFTALIYTLASIVHGRKQQFASGSVLSRSNYSKLSADLGVSVNNCTQQQHEPSCQPLVGIPSPLTQALARMNCVDTLRGICLAFMIFANYGSGGYSFLDHAVWNGMNLADTVFPGFIFLMGVSIPLSLRSMSLKSMMTREGTRSISILSLLVKMFRRAFMLFFLGLVVSNSSDIYLTNLRIFGVLQRFAVSYLICGLIELAHFAVNNNSYLLSENEPEIGRSMITRFQSKFNEFFCYPFQWLVVVLFSSTWTMLTIFLPVPGCPTGYVGPGGRHMNGSFFNCTAGAAGYIDRYLLGETHIYQEPTCKSVYGSTIPHDPEGLLGCLTSCVLTLFGIAAGHVFIHYKEYKKIAVRFLLQALFFACIALLLCKASLGDDGWLPINKNLWSLSFVLATAALSLFLLTLLYLLVDVFRIYSGAPFIFLGRNSITIYMCHILFAGYFPFFHVPNQHAFLLSKTLLGVGLWFFVSYLMNLKKIYINL